MRKNNFFDGSYAVWDSAFENTDEDEKERRAEKAAQSQNKVYFSKMQKATKIEFGISQRT